MMRKEVARAPAAAGLLVGNAGKRKPAFQLVAMLVQQRVGDEACGGAAFHVGNATAI